MKIKLYMVTFNNEYHLNNTLDSLFSSNLNYDLEINIINNHSNLQINNNNLDRLRKFGKYTILHNVLRSDSSWGNTSQNWNQAIVLGFVNILNPDCDLVITCQDDINFSTEWLGVLQQRHLDGMQFIACARGDGLCSYTPECIKTVGLWDERFSFLNWLEHDYFLRAASWLGNNCAIEDQTTAIHNRGGHNELYAHNAHKGADIAWTPVADSIKTEQKQLRQDLGASAGSKLFFSKWGMNPEDTRSACMHNVGNKLLPLIPSCISHLYFEKDIPNLREKGYLI